MGIVEAVVETAVDTAHSHLDTILRERISQGKIPPGTKLNEACLAKEFKVPRSRVRQALSSLAIRGLVEHKPNRGAVVATFGAQEMFKLYDVFELLEGLAARLASQNTQPGSWQDLVDLFGPELEREVAGGNYEALFSAVYTYRHRVVEAADNATLQDSLERIYDKTYVLIRRTLILPGRAMQSLKEHRDVIAALQKGDALEAERLKRENMRIARETLEKYHKFVFDY